MSLIFNALKKLKSDTQQPAGKTSDELHQRSNVYTFGRIFSSPLVILLFFIAGLAIYYGYLLLFAYLHQGPLPAKTPSVSDPPSRSVPAPQPNRGMDTTAEKLEIPDRPDNLPAAELRQVDRQSNPLLPLQAAEATYPADEGVVQYIGKNSLPESGQQAQQNDAAAGNVTSLKIEAGNPEGMEKGVRDGLQAPLDDSENKKEKTYHIKIEKSKTAALLVADIEACIDARDFQKAGQLMEKLKKHSKSGNPYLLKLESYLYFKTGKPDLAEQLLKQVLIQNQYDLEANINMAAIEIQAGRKKDALGRLVKLSKVYPENETVQGLIQKLD